MERGVERDCAQVRLLEVVDEDESFSSSEGGIDRLADRLRGDKGIGDEGVEDRDNRETAGTAIWGVLGCS